MTERVIIKVKEIRGNCAVYKGGEKIIVEGPEINLKETDKICIHALPSLLHYVVALREDVDPVKLGLAKEGSKAYIQCVDQESLTQTAGQLSLKYLSKTTIKGINKKVVV